MEHALVPHRNDHSFRANRLRTTASCDFSAREPSPSMVPAGSEALRRVRRTESKQRAGLGWTVQEDELLAALHPTHSNWDLAAQLGRSHWAIVNRARSLGLTRDHEDRSGPPQDGGRPWSSDEIALLRILYPSLPCEGVAQRIGRSLDAVKMKARRLKLRRSENWSAAEDRLLCESYPDQSGARIAHRLGRTVAAVRARVLTLALPPKVRNWTEEEVRFLREFYAVLGLERIALELGHTRAATAQKARALSLVRYRHWSRADERVLAEGYPRCGTRELADRLGRSYETVRDKAKRLGLRKQAPAEADPSPAAEPAVPAGTTGGDSRAVLCHE